MKTSISCGKGEVTLSLPENNAQILTPHPPSINTDVLGCFRKALGSPSGESLRNLAKGKSVVFLVQDQTRSIGEKKELAEAVLEELAAANPSQTNVIISTGTHKSNDPKNKDIIDMMAALSEKYGLPCSFEEHDCEQDKQPEEYSKHVFIGNTPAGTPVYIHRKVMGADVIVGASSMKMHYFAGYSNMLKLIALPGPCGYETVRKNHFLILDPRSLACSHPLHYKNRDNPVANDMYEAYKLVVSQKLVGGKLVKLGEPRPVFVLASVSDKQDGELGIVWCGAGEAEKVTAEALKIIDKHYTFKAERADILIIGAGPHPYDRHLFYVHNGADTARRGLKKGGSMLVIAECPEGIGPEGTQTKKFVDALKRPKEEVLGYVRDNFQVGMQKSYKMGELLLEASELCVYLSPAGRLDEKELQAMHLKTTTDPQKWLDEKLKQKPDLKILVITKEATRVSLV